MTFLGRARDDPQKMSKKCQMDVPGGTQKRPQSHDLKMSKKCPKVVFGEVQTDVLKMSKRCQMVVLGVHALKCRKNVVR